MVEPLPCGYSSCGHHSGSREEHIAHGMLHFTASVMGNPEYLAAVKDIEQAPDQRMVGIEKLNSFHAHHHAERLKRDKHNGSR